ncbi:MAG: hypothetical protein V1659_01670 [Candidatus Woesearchaeota archaeon]
MVEDDYNPPGLEGRFNQHHELSGFCYEDWFCWGDTSDRTGQRKTEIHWGPSEPEIPPQLRLDRLLERGYALFDEIQEVMQAHSVTPSEETVRKAYAAYARRGLWRQISRLEALTNIKPGFSIKLRKMADRFEYFRRKSNFNLELNLRALCEEPLETRKKEYFKPYMLAFSDEDRSYERICGSPFHNEADPGDGVFLF